MPNTPNGGRRKSRLNGDTSDRSMGRSSGKRSPRHRSPRASRINADTLGGSNRSNVGSADFPAGRKPRGSVVMEEGDFPAGRQPRGSVVVEEGDFPAGRQPRGSVVIDEGDFPDGRKPRGSVVVEEEVIVEEEQLATDMDEQRAKKRRKRIAALVACVLILILFIVIIVILVSVLGTGDEPTPGVGELPETCAVNNETRPITKDEYICDLVTTLTTRESTFLRTFPAGSPYGMSIGWMLKEDTTDFANTPHEYILERFVMILFYFATGGKDWFSKFEFLTQEHICDWTGDSKDAIRCAYATDKKVTDLGMPQNGLTGELPTELGYLTELTRIYFSLNSLSGKIPTELFQLTKLEKLYFDRNDFRGKIPTEINQLTGLTTLLLNNNDFNGNLTEICDVVNATGTQSDFHADCQTGRVNCPCCKTCV
mmetsp:Transcript_37248/g.90461  ORF Transcript_37248/g.90461 Transcript_37248/m.90461 type:complete len:425 (+) Transcript_37248:133-1407(+)|eukprot:CAMPEP_0113622718 /NCGR_PEP_ID=MMETSP0017_2-20120614/11655_1 /TAXON_ID=2856 /ORGANISM="Cylindrotheca closterium" /LENGTH=424 /DNA_ID=CAMNT_0000532583 /DNA_START=83 /DNA_END=1357 /DNA_ORIENTATION=+ /assembly_acc=CAM_ASM_000147